MYIGNDLRSGRSEIYHYTSSSGGETSITTATDGRSINYTVGWCAVYLNGIRLHDSDITVSSGNSVGFASALSQNDVVIVEAAHTFSVSDSVPATGGTFSGPVTFDGGTTTISSVTLIVEDKNIEMGSVDTPTDSTADGGGITLKGTTDKTILWENDTDSWNFNQNIETSTTTKVKQKGAFMQSSTHQALTLGY